MKTTFQTLNSAYEVDFAAETIQRVSGESEPPARFEGEGPKPFQRVYLTERGFDRAPVLVVVWPDGASTITSAVTGSRTVFGDAVPLDELEAFLR